MSFLCGCAGRRRKRSESEDRQEYYRRRSRSASRTPPPAIAATPKVKRKFPTGIAPTPSVPSDLEDNSAAAVAAAKNSSSKNAKAKDVATVKPKDVLQPKNKDIATVAKVKDSTQTTRFKDTAKVQFDEKKKKNAHVAEKCTKGTMTAPGAGEVTGYEQTILPRVRKKSPPVVSAKMEVKLKSLRRPGPIAIAKQCEDVCGSSGSDTPRGYEASVSSSDGVSGSPRDAQTQCGFSDFSDDESSLLSLGREEEVYENTVSELRDPEADPGVTGQEVWDSGFLQHDRIWMDIKSTLMDLISDKDSPAYQELQESMKPPDLTYCTVFRKMDGSLTHKAREDKKKARHSFGGVPTDKVPGSRSKLNLVALRDQSDERSTDWSKNQRNGLRRNVRGPGDDDEYEELSPGSGYEEKLFTPDEEVTEYYFGRRSSSEPEVPMQTSEPRLAPDAEITEFYFGRGASSDMDIPMMKSESQITLRSFPGGTTSEALRSSMSAIWSSASGKTEKYGGSAYELTVPRTETQLPDKISVDEVPAVEGPSVEQTTEEKIDKCSNEKTAVERIEPLIEKRITEIIPTKEESVCLKQVTEAIPTKEEVIQKMVADASPTKEEITNTEETSGSVPEVKMRQRSTVATTTRPFDRSVSESSTTRIVREGTPVVQDLKAQKELWRQGIAFDRKDFDIGDMDVESMDVEPVSPELHEKNRQHPKRVTRRKETSQLRSVSLDYEKRSPKVVRKKPGRPVIIQPYTPARTSQPSAKDHSKHKLKVKNEDRIDDTTEDVKEDDTSDPAPEDISSDAIVQDDVQEQEVLSETGDRNMKQDYPVKQDTCPVSTDIVESTTGLKSPGVVRSVISGRFHIETTSESPSSDSEKSDSNVHRDMVEKPQVNIPASQPESKDERTKILSQSVQKKESKIPVASKQKESLKKEKPSSPLPEIDAVSRFISKPSEVKRSGKIELIDPPPDEDESEETKSRRAKKTRNVGRFLPRGGLKNLKNEDSQQHIPQVISCTTNVEEIKDDHKIQSSESSTTEPDLVVGHGSPHTSLDDQLLKFGNSREDSMSIGSPDVIVQCLGDVSTNIDEMKTPELAEMSDVEKFMRKGGTFEKSATLFSASSASVETVVPAVKTREQSLDDSRISMDVRDIEQEQMDVCLGGESRGIQGKDISEAVDGTSSRIESEKFQDQEKQSENIEYMKNVLDYVTSSVDENVSELSDVTGSGPVHADGMCKIMAKIPVEEKTSNTNVQEKEPAGTCSKISESMKVDTIASTKHSSTAISTVIKSPEIVLPETPETSLLSDSSIPVTEVTTVISEIIHDSSDSSETSNVNFLEETAPLLSPTLSSPGETSPRPASSSSSRCASPKRFSGLDSVHQLPKIETTIDQTPLRTHVVIEDRQSAPVTITRTPRVRLSDIVITGSGEEKLLALVDNGRLDVASDRVSAPVSPAFDQPMPDQERDLAPAIDVTTTSASAIATISSIPEKTDILVSSDKSKSITSTESAVEPEISSVISNVSDDIVAAESVRISPVRTSESAAIVASSQEQSAPEEVLGSLPEQRNSFLPTVRDSKSWTPSDNIQTNIGKESIVTNENVDVCVVKTDEASASTEKKEETKETSPEKTDKAEGKVAKNGAKVKKTVKKDGKSDKKDEKSEKKSSKSKKSSAKAEVPFPPPDRLIRIAVRPSERLRSLSKSTSDSPAAIQTSDSPYKEETSSEQECTVKEPDESSEMVINDISDVPSDNKLPSEVVSQITGDLFSNVDLPSHVRECVKESVLNDLNVSTQSSHGGDVPATELTVNLSDDVSTKVTDASDELAATDVSVKDKIDSDVSRCVDKLKSSRDEKPIIVKEVKMKNQSPNISPDRDSLDEVVPKDSLEIPLSTPRDSLEKEISQSDATQVSPIPSPRDSLDGAQSRRDSNLTVDSLHRDSLSEAVPKAKSQSPCDSLDEHLSKLMSEANPESPTPSAIKRDSVDNLHASTPTYTPRDSLEGSPSKMLLDSFSEMIKSDSFARSVDEDQILSFSSIWSPRISAQQLSEEITTPVSEVVQDFAATEISARPFMPVPYSSEELSPKEISSQIPELSVRPEKLVSTQDALLDQFQPEAPSIIHTPSERSLVSGPSVASHERSVLSPKSSFDGLINSGSQSVPKQLERTGSGESAQKDELSSTSSVTSPRDSLSSKRESSTISDSRLSTTDTSVIDDLLGVGSIVLPKEWSSTPRASGSVPDSPLHTPLRASLAMEECLSSSSATSPRDSIEESLTKHVLGPVPESPKLPSNVTLSRDTTISFSPHSTPRESLDLGSQRSLPGSLPETPHRVSLVDAHLQGSVSDTFGGEVDSNPRISQKDIADSFQKYFSSLDPKLAGLRDSKLSSGSGDSRHSAASDSDFDIVDFTEPDMVVLTDLPEEHIPSEQSVSTLTSEFPAEIARNERTQSMLSGGFDISYIDTSSFEEDRTPKAGSESELSPTREVAKVMEELASVLANAEKGFDTDTSSVHSRPSSLKDKTDSESWKEEHSDKATPKNRSPTEGSFETQLEKDREVFRKIAENSLDVDLDVEATFEAMVSSLLTPRSSRIILDAKEPEDNAHSVDTSGEKEQITILTVGDRSDSKETNDDVTRAQRSKSGECSLTDVMMKQEADMPENESKDEGAKDILVLVPSDSIDKPMQDSAKDSESHHTGIRINSRGETGIRESSFDLSNKVKEILKRVSSSEGHTEDTIAHKETVTQSIEVTPKSDTIEESTSQSGIPKFSSNVPSETPVKIISCESSELASDSTDSELQVSPDPKEKQIRKQSVPGNEKEQSVSKESDALTGSITLNTDEVSIEEKGALREDSRRSIEEKGAFREDSRGSIDEKGAFREDSRRSIEEKGALREDSRGSIEEKGAFREDSRRSIEEKGALREDSRRSIEEKGALREDSRRSIEERGALREDSRRSIEEKGAFREDSRRSIEEKGASREDSRGSIEEKGASEKESRTSVEASSGAKSNDPRDAEPETRVSDITPSNVEDPIETVVSLVAVDVALDTNLTKDADVPLEAVAHKVHSDNNVPDSTGESVVTKEAPSDIKNYPESSLALNLHSSNDEVQAVHEIKHTASEIQENAKQEKPKILSERKSSLPEKGKSRENTPPSPVKERSVQTDAKRRSKSKSKSLSREKSDLEDALSVAVEKNIPLPPDVEPLETEFNMDSLNFQMEASHCSSKSKSTERSVSVEVKLGDSKQKIDQTENLVEGNLDDKVSDRRRAGDWSKSFSFEKQSSLQKSEKDQLFSSESGRPLVKRSVSSESALKFTSQKSLNSNLAFKSHIASDQQRTIPPPMQSVTDGEVVSHDSGVIQQDPEENDKKFEEPTQTNKKERSKSRSISREKETVDSQTSSPKTEGGYKPEAATSPGTKSSPPQFDTDVKDESILEKIHIPVPCEMEAVGEKGEDSGVEDDSTQATTLSVEFSKEKKHSTKKPKSRSREDINSEELADMIQEQLSFIAEGKIDDSQLQWAGPIRRDKKSRKSVKSSKTRSLGLDERDTVADSTSALQDKDVVQSVQTEASQSSPSVSHESVSQETKSPKGSVRKLKSKSTSREEEDTVLEAKLQESPVPSETEMQKDLSPPIEKPRSILKSSSREKVSMESPPIEGKWRHSVDDCVFTFDDAFKSSNKGEASPTELKRTEPKSSSDEKGVARVLSGLNDHSVTSSSFEFPLNGREIDLSSDEALQEYRERRSLRKLKSRSSSREDEIPLPESPFIDEKYVTSITESHAREATKEFSELSFSEPRSPRSLRRRSTSKSVSFEDDVIFESVEDELAESAPAESTESKDDLDSSFDKLRKSKLERRKSPKKKSKSRSSEEREDSSLTMFERSFEVIPEDVPVFPDDRLSEGPETTECIVQELTKQEDVQCSDKSNLKDEYFHRVDFTSASKTDVPQLEVTEVISDIDSSPPVQEYQKSKIERRKSPKKKSKSKVRDQDSEISSTTVEPIEDKTSRRIAITPDWSFEEPEVNILDYVIEDRPRTKSTEKKEKSSSSKDNSIFESQLQPSSYDECVPSTSGLLVTCDDDSHIKGRGKDKIERRKSPKKKSKSVKDEDSVSSADTPIVLIEEHFSNIPLPELEHPEDDLDLEKPFTKIERKKSPKKKSKSKKIEIEESEAYDEPLGATVIQNTLAIPKHEQLECGQESQDTVGDFGVIGDGDKLAQPTVSRRKSPKKKSKSKGDYPSTEVLDGTPSGRDFFLPTVSTFEIDKTEHMFDDGHPARIQSHTSAEGSSEHVRNRDVDSDKIDSTENATILCAEVEQLKESKSKSKPRGEGIDSVLDGIIHARSIEATESNVDAQPSLPANGRAGHDDVIIFTTTDDAKVSEKATSVSEDERTTQPGNISCTTVQTENIDSPAKEDRSTHPENISSAKSTTQTENIDSAKTVSAVDRILITRDSSEDIVRLSSTSIPYPKAIDFFTTITSSRPESMESQFSKSLPPSRTSLELFAQRSTESLASNISWNIPPKVDVRTMFVGNVTSPSKSDAELLEFFSDMSGTVPEQGAVSKPTDGSDTPSVSKPASVDAPSTKSQSFEDALKKYREKNRISQELSTDVRVVDVRDPKQTDAFSVLKSLSADSSKKSLSLEDSLKEILKEKSSDKSDVASEPRISQHSTASNSSFEHENLRSIEGTSTIPSSPVKEEDNDTLNRKAMSRTNSTASDRAISKSLLSEENIEKPGSFDVERLDKENIVPMSPGSKPPTRSSSITSEKAILKTSQSFEKSLERTSSSEFEGFERERITSVVSQCKPFSRSSSTTSDKGILKPSRSFEKSMDRASTSDVDNDKEAVSTASLRSKPTSRSSSTTSEKAVSKLRSFEECTSVLETEDFNNEFISSDALPMVQTATSRPKNIDSREESQAGVPIAVSVPLRWSAAIPENLDFFCDTAELQDENIEKEAEMCVLENKPIPVQAKSPDSQQKTIDPELKNIVSDTESVSESKSLVPHKSAESQFESGASEIKSVANEKSESKSISLAPEVELASPAPKSPTPQKKSTKSTAFEKSETKNKKVTSESNIAGDDIKWKSSAQKMSVSPENKASESTTVSSESKTTTSKTKTTSTTKSPVLQKKSGASDPRSSSFEKSETKSKLSTSDASTTVSEGKSVSPVTKTPLPQKKSAATDCKTSTPDTKLKTTASEKTIDPTSSETKMKTTSPPKKMQTTSSETKVQTTPSETKMQTTPSEKKMKTTSSETKMKTTPSEIKMKTTSPEKKMQTVPSEKTQATRSEAKTKTPPTEKTALEPKSSSAATWTATEAVKSVVRSALDAAKELLLAESPRVRREKSRSPRPEDATQSRVPAPGLAPGPVPGLVPGPVPALIPAPSPSARRRRARARRRAATAGAESCGPRSGSITSSVASPLDWAAEVEAELPLEGLYEPLDAAGPSTPGSRRKRKRHRRKRARADAPAVAVPAAAAPATPAAPVATPAAAAATAVAAPPERIKRLKSCEEDSDASTAGATPAPRPAEATPTRRKEQPRDSQRYRSPPLSPRPVDDDPTPWNVVRSRRHRRQHRKSRSVEGQGFRFQDPSRPVRLSSGSEGGDARSDVFYFAAPSGGREG